MAQIILLHSLGYITAEMCISLKVVDDPVRESIGEISEVFLFFSIHDWTKGLHPFFRAPMNFGKNYKKFSRNK
jgi:hypothetical protein